MYVVFVRDQAGGAPGARHRARNKFADTDWLERLCCQRSLPFASLVQRGMRKLVALGAVPLGLAVAHEDEALAGRRKRNRGGKLRDPFVAEKVDDLSHACAMNFLFM